MSATFCESCFKKTHYTSVERVREVTVRGTAVIVPYKAPICDECGEELYDTNVECDILRNAKTLYRNKARMTPGERVRKYMQRNQLTTEQMAEKVGCAVRDILYAADDALLDRTTDAKIRSVISA